MHPHLSKLLCMEALCEERVIECHCVNERSKLSLGRGWSRDSAIVEVG